MQAAPHFFVTEADTYPIDAVVTVAGFTLLLWWIPKPEVRALPAACALIFAPYWVEAAFTAYVAAMMLGTLYMLIDMGGVFTEGG